SRKNSMTVWESRACASDTNSMEDRFPFVRRCPVAGHPAPEHIQRCKYRVKADDKCVHTHRARPAYAANVNFRRPNFPCNDAPSDRQVRTLLTHRPKDAYNPTVQGVRTQPSPERHDSVGFRHSVAQLLSIRT